MGGVIVYNGELCFTARYTLEWSILGRGADGARQHINELLETVTDEGMRHMLEEMNRTPAIVPSDREDIYSRAYALIKEGGRGVQEEMLKVGYPLDEVNLLLEAFLQGVCDIGLQREDARDNYIGVAKLCYSLGALAANSLVWIFPEDENEIKPDFDSLYMAFRSGLLETEIN
jgi:hypothetical protein